MTTRTEFSKVLSTCLGVPGICFCETGFAACFREPHSMFSEVLAHFFRAYLGKGCKGLGSSFQQSPGRDTLGFRCSRDKFQGCIMQSSKQLRVFGKWGGYSKEAVGLQR